MKVETERGLRMTMTHGPSGVKLLSDAPKDNGGEASSFSPTDLLAASLVSCITTTMALTARRENVPWGSIQASLEKRMTAEPPRRVAEVAVELQMPKELPTDKRSQFEAIAHTCPVARSLHSDVKISVTFHYPA
jgi:uncharacterized OsmC-like protein